MEKYKIKKVGRHAQYGEWMLADDGSEKGKFLGITQQVSGFLSNQVPCEVSIEERQDIENRKGVITRVKVLGKSEGQNKFEQPQQTIQETPKQEFNTARDYKPSETYTDRQESIVNQMCIKKGADLLMKTDEQINFVNLLKYSELVKSVYDTMMNKKSEIPDY